ncbi:MAG TPA: hypothetical protein VMH83_06260 [Candidatus Acidoferrum sp.]|nr:hypothetical protein [Candidatus Acidoferrum sp.]
MFPTFTSPSGGGFPFALSSGPAVAGDVKNSIAGVSLGDYGSTSPWLMVAVLGIAAVLLLRR